MFRFVPSKTAKTPVISDKPIGHWEFVNDYESRCSVCGENSEVDHDNEPPFCQWCGRPMLYPPPSAIFRKVPVAYWQKCETPGLWKCSNCGSAAVTDETLKWQFCHCGALMNPPAADAVYEQ